MQILLLRFLTRLMAIMAIIGGFAVGVTSFDTGESTYAIVLILIGMVVGWRGAIWATQREVKEAEASLPSEAKPKLARKSRPKGGKHKH